MKLIYLLTIAIMLYCRMGHAQTMSKEPVGWKKRVSRIVDMQAQKDTVRQAIADSTVFEILLDAINHDHLTAFSARDGSPAEKITKGELEYLLPRPCKIDTEVVHNTLTGKDEVRIKRPEYNYRNIQKFEIAEEWSFYPDSGKTDVKILGIAPVWEVYGDDGVFRRFHALFYLGYPDAVSVLKKYQQNHRSNPFAEKIWNDYFLTD